MMSLILWGILVPGILFIAILWFRYFFVRPVKSSMFMPPKFASLGFNIPVYTTDFRILLSLYRSVFEHNEKLIKENERLQARILVLETIGKKRLRGAPSNTKGRS